MSYRDRDFASMVRTHDATLVSPPLRPYFPCAATPSLSRGITEVPRYLIPVRDAYSPVMYPTSPFRGVLDLYSVKEVSLGDSQHAPLDVVSFAVDTRIPGAAIARPDVRES